MAIWVCRNCTAKYAVGLFRCPQCRAESSYELEGAMSPKINRHGNVTDAAADDQEDTWPGNSTETSSEKQPTSDETSSPDDRPPAPTTESPSETDQTESSSVPSTDGAGKAASRRTAKKATAKKPEAEVSE